ncbi:hypothetical protein, partial [Enterococcus faecium]|uniref:hypothetical protein n=1 Tax=Enterococcus faecium TaxID=1352 RepID=UPI001A999DFE
NFATEPFTLILAPLIIQNRKIPPQYRKTTLIPTFFAHYHHLFKQSPICLNTSTSSINTATSTFSHNEKLGTPLAYSKV